MFKDQTILQAQELSNGDTGRRATTRIAHRILREYKKQSHVKKPPYDPQVAAQFCGINVETTDTISVSSGRFLSTGDKPSILLKQKETDYRRRFTCAHELGHAIIRGYCEPHTQLPLLNPESTNEEEIRANIFASDFLMPEKDLMQVLKAQGSASDAESVAVNLSHTFAVHPFAVVYRLSDFELPTKQWLFLILKYMTHPAKARNRKQRSQPKLRVIRSATPETMYVPWVQGADSIGLSIGNLTLEQLQDFHRSKYSEKMLVKMLDDKGTWRNAELHCRATYRGASSPAAGPVVLGFLTVEKIRLLP